MDIVEAGRDRRPLRPFWYVATAVALAALAVAGTVRAQQPAAEAQARPVASAAPVPPLETVAPATAPVPLPGPALRDGERLGLLLVSEGAVSTYDTGRVVSTQRQRAAYAIRSHVRLADGYAAVAHPQEFDSEARSRLVGRRDGGSWSVWLPGAQRVIAGADDDEFWTVTWLNDRAQRRDAGGDAVGRPVALPEGYEPVRVLADGTFLMNRVDLDLGIAVWDPARRRVTRTISTDGGILAAGARRVAWRPPCEPRTACPVHLTDVRTGRTRTVPLPEEAGSPHGGVLDPGETSLAYLWGGDRGPFTAYVAKAGGDVVEFVADGLEPETPMTWTADGRLVAFTDPRGAAARFVVWDRAHGARHAPAPFEAFEASAIAAW